MIHLVNRFTYAAQRVRQLVAQERSLIAGTMGINLLLGSTGLITGALLARSLGPVGRGKIASIQAMPSFFSGIVMLGFQESLVYCAIRNPERRKQYLTASLLASTAFAALVTVVLVSWPGGLAQRSSAHEFFTLFVLLAPLLNVPFQMLRAVGNYRAWNLLKVPPVLAWLLICIVAAAIPALRRPGVITSAYVIALAAMTPMFIRAGHRAAGGWGKPSGGDYKTLLRYSLPVMLTTGPAIVSLRLDTVLVASRFGSRANGFYAAAVAWSVLALPLFSAISSLALPLVARGEQEGRDESAPIVVGSILLGALLIAASLPATRLFFPLIFGDAFLPAWRLGALALCAGIIQGLTQVVGAVLRGKGQITAPLVAELLGVALTLATLSAFLDHFGITGGQYTSLLAYTATLAVGCVLWLNVRKRPVKKFGATEPEQLT